MQYKQPEIIETLEKRIADGTYKTLLPTSKMLAEEFRVNIKTVNKAVARLVRRGLVVRKRHVGTQVVKKDEISASVPQLVEVLYEGFTAIFTHPFWSDIWDGMVSELSRHKFRPVLNMLNSDPETGLLKTDDISLLPGISKIVLGISEDRLLNMIKNMSVHFITACDNIDDPDVPQVYFDMRDAISEAVEYLFSLGCSRIAFIGSTGSLVNPGNIQKYRSFIKAVQKRCKLDSKLICNIRPLAGAGRAAMETMLARTTCDAVFAAYDHHLPDIYEVLEEHGLSHIPVIGCDGLEISAVPANRYAVISPRRACGELLAKSFVEMMQGRDIPKQQSLRAGFGRMNVNSSGQKYL
ncbi:MAG: GntR family transcriptional regulator [Lentisphaeria bacterium]|nr:GntR family transcriptional regulator [Lentisphaeria bacterium]